MLKDVLKLFRPEEIVVLMSCSIYDMRDYFKIK